MNNPALIAILYVVQKYKVPVIVGLVCLAVGSYVTHKLSKPPPPQVIHDVKTQVEYRDRVVTVEKPVDRWRDRVVTIIKYAPDGGVASETKSETKSGEHKGEVVTTETDTGKEKVNDSLRVVPAPVSPLHAYLEVGPYLDLQHGGVQLSATAGVTYHVLGPVYVGAEAILPNVLRPSPPVVGLTVGVGL